MGRIGYSSLLNKILVDQAWKKEILTHLDILKDREVEKTDDKKRNDELEDPREHSVPKERRYKETVYLTSLK